MRQHEEKYKSAMAQRTFDQIVVSGHVGEQYVKVRVALVARDCISQYGHVFESIVVVVCSSSCCTRAIRDARPTR